MNEHTYIIEEKQEYGAREVFFFLGGGGLPGIGHEMGQKHIDSVVLKASKPAKASSCY